MKANILSLSIAMVIVAVITMDFNMPSLLNNTLSYSLMGLSTLMFAGLYIHNLQTAKE